MQAGDRKVRLLVNRYLDFQALAASKGPPQLEKGQATQAQMLVQVLTCSTVEGSATKNINANPNTARGFGNCGTRIEPPKLHHTTNTFNPQPSTWSTTFLRYEHLKSPLQNVFRPNLGPSGSCQSW